MTPFDEAILPGELKMFKAFLPFLPANLQKMCAIYIKWMELKATIDYYDQHPPVPGARRHESRIPTSERDPSTGRTGFHGAAGRYDGKYGSVPEHVRELFCSHIFGSETR